MTAALERGEWTAARPDRTLPPGKIQYPFHRRLGGAPRAYLDGVKISSQPVFDPGPSRLSSVAIPTELPGPYQSGPECSWKLKLLDFVTTAQDGGKFVSLTHRPPLPPRKYSWYSLLLEAESTTRATVRSEVLCQ